jgi:flagellin-like protein
MKRRMFIRRDEEGVSPVIATILMVAITVVLAAVLYIMVIGIGDGGPQPPRGAWGAKKIIDRTTVTIDFAEVTPDQTPMDLKILLTRNETTEGTYTFTSNDDGALSLSKGPDVGDLAYSDLADNGIVSIGDRIVMTDLAPGSEYEIIMIWVHNGDSIASATFSTPG